MSKQCNERVLVKISILKANFLFVVQMYCISDFLVARGRVSLNQVASNIKEDVNGESSAEDNQSLQDEEIADTSHVTSLLAFEGQLSKGHDEAHQDQADPDHGQGPASRPRRLQDVHQILPAHGQPRPQPLHVEVGQEPGPGVVVVLDGGHVVRRGVEDVQAVGAGSGALEVVVVVAVLVRLVGDDGLKFNVGTVGVRVVVGEDHVSTHRRYSLHWHH